MLPDVQPVSRQCERYLEAFELKLSQVFFLGTGQRKPNFFSPTGKSENLPKLCMWLKPNFTLPEQALCAYSPDGGTKAII